MSDILTYSVDGDGIATLVWDDPNRPVNVINDASTASFIKTVEALVAEDSVKGVILTSGKKDFVVGADLEQFLAAGDDHKAIMSLLTNFHGALRTMETSGKPFVAAMNGAALGGGLEVAIGCHHRVAADNPKARFGFPEAQIGLLPGGGGTQRIPRMIGIRPGLPFLLESKRIDAQAAKEMGVIDQVVPAEDLMKVAKEWALANPEAAQPWDDKKFRLPGGAVQTPKGIEAFMGGEAMLKGKTMGNYRAQQLIMQCVYEGLQVPIDTGLKIEIRYFTELLVSKQAKAMIRSLFFGIQEANKLKRRPQGFDKAEFKKVGVLGAGMMGAGIAYQTAAAGIEVVLLDTDANNAAKGKAYSEALLAKRVKRGKMAQAKMDGVLGLIKPTSDYADLAGCDLVIEAVFEDRKIKKAVLQQTEAAVGEDCLIASNTSTLPISGLAEFCKDQENFIGLHFFSPVEKMPLLEIIVGEKTNQAALAKSLDFAQRIGKTPIVVNDSRGFYTSRVFSTYIKEGLALLKEGVKPALIENAGKLAGMPVGPLAIADEVSLGLMHYVQTQTKEDLGGDYQEQPADSVVQLFVEQLKRVGKKDGKGFYDYPEGGEKRLWPDLEKHFPLAKQQPDVEEVKKRLLYIQCLETVRCMDENVVETASEADVGSILGWGFAPFLGGVLSAMEVIGIDNVVNDCNDFATKCGDRFQVPASLKAKAEKGELFHVA